MIDQKKTLLGKRSLENPLVMEDEAYKRQRCSTAEHELSTQQSEIVAVPTLPQQQPPVTMEELEGLDGFYGFAVFQNYFYVHHVKGKKILRKGLLKQVASASWKSLSEKEREPFEQQASLNLQRAPRGVRQRLPSGSKEAFEEFFWKNCARFTDANPRLGKKEVRQNLRIQFIEEQRHKPRHHSVPPAEDPEPLIIARPPPRTPAPKNVLERPIDKLKRKVSESPNGTSLQFPKPLCGMELFISSNLDRFMQKKQIPREAAITKIRQEWNSLHQDYKEEWEKSLSQDAA